MPKEIRKLKDLPQDVQDKLEIVNRKVIERKKDPTNMSVQARLKRIEIILGIEGGD